jgi:hypothetical protein
MLYDIEEHIRISKCIDASDEAAADRIQDSLRDRWEHGRMMAEERGGKKKLPDGRMAELVAATGKSAQELSYRMQFAERYPTEDQFSTAVENCTSWNKARAGLPKPTKPKPESGLPTSAPAPHPRREELVELAEQGMSSPEISKATGVPRDTLRRELERVAIERKAQAEAATIDWKSIPATAQQKLDMARRQIRNELEVEAQARVTAEIQRIFDRTRAEYEQLKARTDRILDSHKGVFTKADFSVIQACLHPDNSASAEKRAQAFDLFRAAQDVLVGEKDQPTKRIELPSLDELKRRRESKQ